MVPDGAWRLPGGRLELTDDGLVLHRRARRPRHVPWRAVSRIDRPSDDSAELLLTDGSVIRLPQRTDADAVWLDVIAARVEAEAQREIAPNEWAVAVRETLHQGFTVLRLDEPGPYWGWVLAITATVGLTGWAWALLTGSVAGLGLATACTAALAFAYAAVQQPPARLNPRAVRIDDCGLEFRFARSLPIRIVWEQCGELERSAQGWCLPMPSGSSVMMTDSPGARRLQHILRAVVGVREGHFEGVAPTPVPDGALSRLKGETLDAERGLSRIED